ncbi:MAG: 4Fe-4S dicluster domain-containing protein [Chloroflexota bacterium]
MEHQPATRRVAAKARTLGIVHINGPACKQCGFCIEFCPTDVLAVSEESNVKGYHPPVVVAAELCNACDLCTMLCPEFAIWVEKVKIPDERAKEALR